MENQGFEGEHQSRNHDSQAFLSSNKRFPDDSASNADGHVYEDVLPCVEEFPKHTVVPSCSLDPREPISNGPLEVDRISTETAANRQEIPGVLRRNLTLPFRRGTGSSTVTSSVRLTNRERSEENAETEYGFASRGQSMIQNECRPNRRRRKKDCKHCRSKAAAFNDAHVDEKETETVLRKNQDNERRLDDPGTILDPRNFSTMRCSPCLPIRNDLPVNDDLFVFTISEKIRGSPSTVKLIERNEDRGVDLVDKQANNQDVLIASEKSRTGMKVNSIYSPDRWYAEEPAIFVTDVKEQSPFQRAYSLPVRTQTPSSQNRINQRRSVRGEPPPHPARLRKHRHGWTLHLAHPLETNGCTRPPVLLLIALLVLLGIGAVALYIAFEPEKLNVIRQYLKSTNGSSLDDNDAFNDTTSSPLAASTLLNSDRSFPESGGNATTSEPEAEATSLSSINSTRYCDDCLTEEVCVAPVDEEVPTCRIPLDTEDPTGCAGFCLINRQKCHRLDVDAFRCVEIEHYCLEDEWTCLNTLCIPLSKHCDGHMNCYDHSDEYNCDCDLKTHFQCGNETSCLPLEKRCDGKIDCWDAADEINCTLACPSKNEFTCSNGQCILRVRFCDGLPDCLDGSDEPHGCQGRCNKQEYTCQNSRCITKGMKCNGVDDCGDGSDERHCKDRFS